MRRVHYIAPRNESPAERPPDPPPAHRQQSSCLGGSWTASAHDATPRRRSRHGLGAARSRRRPGSAGPLARAARLAVAKPTGEATLFAPTPDVIGGAWVT